MTASSHQLSFGSGTTAQATTAVSATSIDGPEPRVCALIRFDGDPQSCGASITNCTLLFSLQPRTFASEAATVAYTITHLTRTAYLWEAEEWEQQTPACSSFQAFAAELRQVFGCRSSGDAATGELLTLRQGQQSVMDFAIDF